MLRAVAILSVLHIHAFAYLHEMVPPSAYRLLWPVSDGVSLFFVLSGFLVGRILIRHLSDGDSRSFSLMAFWTPRWLRTLPLYFIALAACVLLIQPEPSTWLPYALFSQNLAWPHPPFFAEAWSLAIEEWFYLSAPVCAWFLARTLRLKPTQTALAVGLIGLAVSMIYRYWQAGQLSDPSFAVWDQSIRKVVLARFDGLAWGLIGAATSIAFPHAWRRWAGWAGLAGVALMSVSILRNPLWSSEIGAAEAVWFPFYEALGMACLLPFACLISTPTSWITARITWIARASYALYLVNFTLTFFALSRFGISPGSGVQPWLGAAAYVVLVFAIGGAAYQLLDRPLENWRQRWLAKHRAR